MVDRQKAAFEESHDLTSLVFLDRPENVLN